MKLNKWREGELEGRGVGRKRWDKSPHLCPYVTALCTSTGKRKIPCNCFIHLNYLSLWLANGEKKGKKKILLLKLRHIPPPHTLAAASSSPVIQQTKQTRQTSERAD